MPSSRGSPLLREPTHGPLDLGRHWQAGSLPLAQPGKHFSPLKVKVTQSCPTLLRSHGLYSPWNSPGQNTGVDSLSLLWGIFLTQVKPRSPALQADSLPVELPGKPRSTGVGSLSILQWIFPTQELNWGLLHCKWIMYQLGY